ncbi:MAG: type IV pilin, partial [Methanomicrobia archaeon]|nr:type IV pilin [Methanomicrobia archaeon]
MNKKCISPIIAVVLLITITLTAASLLRVWYFNEQQQSQERTSGLIDKKIQEKEEEIDIESYDTNGTLYIRNTGLTTINTDSIEIYEEENPLSGYTFSTSTLYSGDILAIWNLTLTIGKTYRITTEIGYTEIFEYNVGNVFLYSDDETIFNNGDSTTITAVTVDNFDNRVGNIDVTFQTTLGTFSESGTSTYTTSTNPSGEATATLVSDTNTGRAKISALAGNYTSMTSVNIEYWWDASWAKRKKIMIEENSGNDLTDYQIKMSVSYDSDMQPDYDDLRFVDSGGNLLD